MILVTESIVGLYIGVWAETWRARLDDGETCSIQARKEAQERHDNERQFLRKEDWITVYEAAAGYQESNLSVPYSGARPYLGYKPVDDPDPRLFLFLTVEIAVLSLRDDQRALAEHTFIHRRCDRDFRYRAKPGETQFVPRSGRVLTDWCKKTRARVIRPTIKRAIETRMPENIVESALLEAGLISA